MSPSTSVIRWVARLASAAALALRPVQPAPLPSSHHPMTESIDSLCPYCGVVCQVRYHLTDARIAWAEGINGPSNRGRLCVRAASAGTTVSIRIGSPCRWCGARTRPRHRTPLIRRGSSGRRIRPRRWTAPRKVSSQSKNAMAPMCSVVWHSQGSNEEGYSSRTNSQRLRHQFSLLLRAALPLQFHRRAHRPTRLGRRHGRLYPDRECRRRLSGWRQPEP